MRLFINNQKIDLATGVVISQTKQVNDIASVDSRNSNNTNTFKLPKTSNNLRALNFMTLPGNQSTVPYQQNKCSLYSDNGDCFVYNGWAKITDNGDYFQAYVVDGIYDIFKNIENLTLSDIGLEELTHRKTSLNVIATWQEDKPYRYILADYNGDTGNVNTDSGVTPTVNIDYLVPSVNVAWLWHKIFEKLNYTYKGLVFDTINFKELWMSYPKGQVIQGDNDHTIFNSGEYHFTSPSGNGIWNAVWDSFNINELDASYNNIHMQVAETATYRVKVSGYLAGYVGDISRPLPAKIYLGKNGQNAPTNGTQNIPVFRVVRDNIPSETDFDLTSDIFNLEAGDTICVLITRADGVTDPYQGLLNTENNIEVTLYRVDPNEIDFSNAFKDFNVKDFIIEILQRFGLTMYKDKYEPDYTFTTLGEQLRTASTIDWSDKMASKGAENYINGTYAKRNWMRYLYNDKEASYNDHYIDVSNYNLEDSKDVIKSKIYSPEASERKFLNESSKVYKLWNKEIVQDPQPGDPDVLYEPLDRRYYFMRSIERNKTINLDSKDLAAQFATTSFYYRENYYKLPFYDIIAEYYAPLQQILTRAQIVDVYLNLSDLDIISLDFKKLYYFKQLGNYYMLNKAENYIPGRLTKCEMIRVLMEEISTPPQSIKITKVVTEGVYSHIYFEMAIAVPVVSLEFKRLGASTWSSISISSTDIPYTKYFAGPYTVIIRIKAGAEYSNEVSFPVPSFTTIG